MKVYNMSDIRPYLPFAQHVYSIESPPKLAVLSLFHIDHVWPRCSSQRLYHR
jgi:hypothetical protein